MSTRPPLPRHLFTIAWLGSHDAAHNDQCVLCMNTAVSLSVIALQNNMGRAALVHPYHGATVARVTYTDRLRGLRVG